MKRLTKAKSKIKKKPSHRHKWDYSDGCNHCGHYESSCIAKDKKGDYICFQMRMHNSNGKVIDDNL